MMRVWLERQRGLIDFSIAHQRRHIGRNLGLLLAYAALVFLLASVILFGDALRREARMLLADAPDIIIQRLSAGRQDLMPAENIDTLRGMRGIHTVEGRLWGYHYDPAIGANYTLMAATTEPPARGEMRIGGTLARVRGLQIGDMLALRAVDGTPHTWRIAKVFDAASDLIAADLIVLDPSDWRAFFGIPEPYFTDIAVHVGNPRESAKLAEKIIARLPGTRVLLKDEMRRTYDAVFNWRQGLLLSFLTTVLLAFALLVWDKASGLSAEDRREIGILKAIGWETRDVLLMKLWEGVLLSGIAFLAGYALAYAHVFHLGGALFEPILKGWSVLYPRFRLTPEIDALQIASLFLLSVLPYTVATLVPAWRAATLDPDEIIRA
jgi:ABC-type lipoprotein release transport system permease subunit